MHVAGLLDFLSLESWIFYKAIEESLEVLNCLFLFINDV